MSRAFFRKPDFRLHLGYPSVTLFRGAAGPVATADLAASDPGAALASLAGVVGSAGGRLTAVLPEGEVWRSLIELPARSPLARRRLARAAAAGGLSTSPDAVAVVLGRRNASGRTPVAAVRRDILAEARRFMAGAGLRPTAITGAGSFPGFAAPPRLWSRDWGAAHALRAVGRPAPVAALGVCAFLGLALALRPAPEAALPPAAAIEPAAALAAAPAMPAFRPAPRPADFVPPATAEARPTASEARGAGPAPKVTVATRNVDFLPPLPKNTAAPALRLANLTTARSRLADVTDLLPFRRPATAAQEAAARVPASAPKPEPVAAAAPKATVAPEAISRPRPRPGSPTAAAEVDPPVTVAAGAPVAATASAARAAPAVVGQRPLPRSDAARVAAAAEPAVRVASLGTGPEVAALVAAALHSAAAPEPRIVSPAARPITPTLPKPKAAPPAAAKPAPQRQASPQPVRVQPAQPVVQQQARPQPVQVQPAKPVVRQQARPAPERKATPRPVRVASAAPAPEQVRQRRASSARPARSGLVLVGIFGSAEGRHALVQLPNGAVKRVQTGDSVQGVQVAAIGTDGVRLSGKGRDAVLRLPE